MLIDFVIEVINIEIELFGEIKGIDVNVENIKYIVNIKICWFIKLLFSINNIVIFMWKMFWMKISFLKKYGINV